MSFHPKQFENVYNKSRDRRAHDPDKIGVVDMSYDEYITLFRDFLNEFYIDLFRYCVRFRWMKMQFVYGNQRLRSPARNSFRDIVFSRITRRVVGKDTKIVNRTYFYPKLETYMDEFFPHFNDGNPFTNPEEYEFPFKNISIDLLMVVYQMPDRMEYLEEADRRHMSYADFLDFVLNQIYSENEKLGRDRYIFMAGNYDNHPPYVKDKDNRNIQRSYKGSFEESKML